MKKLIFLIIFILLATSCFAFSKRDHISEGQGKIYMTKNNLGYIVDLVSVSDTSRQVVFKVNGERTKSLEEKEGHYFSDGSYLFVADVIIQDEGPDYVMYYFSSGASPMKINLDNPVGNIVAEVQGEYEILQVDEYEKIPLNEVIEEAIDIKQRNVFEMLGDIFKKFFLRFRR